MPRLKEIATAVPISEAHRGYKVLSLRQLKKRLKAGRPLPKDAFVRTDLHGLHSNTYRHRDRHFERAVLHALVGGDQNDQTLALRICNCRHRHRCGRLACYICNQRYWRKRRALADGFAAQCTDNDISWCTLVIGVSHAGYPVIERMIMGFKAEFARCLVRFENLKWSGRIEIDYLDSRVVATKPEKEKTLLALKWEQDCELAALVPHVHLIVVHPGIRREVVAYHLRKSFSESRRLQVKALRVTRDRDVSLDHMTRYPLKPPLDPAYLAGRSSKNRVPRRPDVVRYMIRVGEAFDRPSRRGLLEFDCL